ncbi:MAG: hypothetical protein GY953_52255 [bacterium]|nr:hypothetical protein [bacterium]
MGGLLVTDYTTAYTPDPTHWRLNATAHGVHTQPAVNGGHGVQTGNPQKVFVNGVLQ